MRSAAISLDGALDYELGDREEWTMELSLWAEGFRDLLCHAYGMQIYHALCDKWCVHVTWQDLARCRRCWQAALVSRATTCAPVRVAMT